MLNLTSPTIVKSLLEQHNITLSKHLGQNFLIDKNILNKIVKQADLSKDDIVVEVGPGIGVLTRELANEAKKVIAIEKDKKISEVLKEVVKDFKNIEIINEDILGWVCDTRQGYKVIANLPYYITSPVIRKFLELSIPPDLMVLMVQKEVAQRIAAKPPNMSVLSVAVQFYSQPKIIAKVSRTCFYPIPKVDSAIIKMVKDDQYIKKIKGKEKRFFQLVKAGFSSKRKQLLGNIIRSFSIPRELAEKIFNKVNLNNKIRAQELTVKQWIELLQEIKDVI